MHLCLASGWWCAHVRPDARMPAGPSENEALRTRQEKSSLHYHHASRSPNTAFQEQACCSKPGRIVMFARNSRQPAKPQLSRGLTRGSRGYDRAAGNRNMPSKTRRHGARRPWAHIGRTPGPRTKYRTTPRCCDLCEPGRYILLLSARGLPGTPTYT